MNQSLSQPTKYIPLAVHKAPELTKLQAASYVEVMYTHRWNRATMENSYLLLKLKACAGQRIYPLRTPRLGDTVLDAHTCEPITITQESYLDVLRFSRWSQPGHNPKLAQFISEIRVERSHLMFCTNCHKIDITTGYCSWVEIHPYKKKQYW